jgi:hypothetical protein
MNDILFFAADSEPYGKTYGNWTVYWWRWVLSIPKSNNPVLDERGEHHNLAQKDDNVLFLAGKLADENRNVPNRTCTLSSKKSILFPVINCECNLLERPELRTPSDIIERVKKDEDTIVKKECFVDGKTIPAQRVRSDPTIFELNMVKDNLFDNEKEGRRVYGSTIASADGYWVFLKPLAVGKHIISFKGSCEYGRLNSGAFYELEVH